MFELRAAAVIVGCLWLQRMDAEPVSVLIPIGGILIVFLMEAIRDGHETFLA